MYFSAPGIHVCGVEVSPIIHIRLENSSGSRQNDQAILDDIATKCQEQGLAVITAKYLEFEEHRLPPPR